VLPAGQRLDGDGVALGVEDRLVEQRDVAGLDGVAQLRDQAQLVPGLGTGLLVQDGDPAPCRRPSPGTSRCRSRGSGPRRRCARRSGRRPRRWRRTGCRPRPGASAWPARWRPARPGRPRRSRRPSRRPPRTRHRRSGPPVTRAHRGAQPLGDLDEQFVAGGVAERVVTCVRHPRRREVPRRGWNGTPATTARGRRSSPRSAARRRAAASGRRASSVPHPGELLEGGAVTVARTPRIGTSRSSGVACTSTGGSPSGRPAGRCSSSWYWTTADSPWHRSEYRAASSGASSWKRWSGRNGRSHRRRSAVRPAGAGGRWRSARGRRGGRAPAPPGRRPGRRTGRAPAGRRGHPSSA
jgi:hypothetical protein